MNYLLLVKDWFAGFSTPKKSPRVVVFGDSHTAALVRAQEFPDRGDFYEHIEIVRVRKKKGKKRVGDVELEWFCKMIGKLNEKDFVFSTIGGNQYAVVSTVRSSIDFDFIDGPTDDDVASDIAQLIPMRVMTGYIQSGILGNDGPVLRAIRKATKAKVFHLSPPPPKEDNSFISQYFETRFADEGIDQLGPTRPELRLKCWNVQSHCLKELCEELNVIWIAPPAGAVTEAGFLEPRCYAKDATHANRRYGELVLRQIMEITGGAALLHGQTGPKAMVEKVAS